MSISTIVCQRFTCHTTASPIHINIPTTVKRASCVHYFNEDMWHSSDNRLLVATVECAVINLPEEIVALVNSTILREVEAEDKQVPSEKNTQQADVINSEPLVGSLSCYRSSGGEDGWYQSGSNS